MDAMPQMYRDDITRTQQAIAAWGEHATHLQRRMEEPGQAVVEYTRLGMSIADAHWHQDRLRIQLEELERALVRAEQDWAAAQAQGAGVRLDP